MKSTNLLTSLSSKSKVFPQFTCVMLPAAPVYAQAALCEGSASAARAWSLKTKLQSRLAALTALIRDRDQTPISFEPARLKKIFAPKKCYSFGMCVCGAVDEKGKLSLRVHERVAAVLKKICWSRKKPVQQKSEARILLENASLVLRFGRSLPESLDDMKDASALWFHVGFANYKTWALTFHQLILSAVTSEAGRQSVKLLSASFEDTVGTKCFRSSCEAFHDSLDFEDPIMMSLHAIDASARPVAELDMKLGIVAVMRLPADGVEVGDLCVWKGRQAEEPQPRGSAQGSRRGRGRGRSTRQIDTETVLDDVLDGMNEVACIPRLNNTIQVHRYGIVTYSRSHSHSHSHSCSRVTSHYSH